MISHLYLDSIIYRKDFVTGIRDIPNRYRMGSSVVINSEDDTVLVDGKPEMGDVVDASKWVAIPPGESTLEVYFSSWCKRKPDVKIEFEERWL